MSKIAAVVLASVCLMLCSVPMSAQLIPHGNAYVGASYSSSVYVVTRESFRGWNASLEFIPFSRYSFVGLVVDGSGYYRPGISEYSILAGPRLAAHFGKLRPFVQGFAGIKRVPVNGITYQPVATDLGGGFDYKLPFRNFSWRVQADYMHTRYLGANQNDVRGSTGIVWRF
ncbi:MAG: hypothetical protein LAO24_17285 [Acidobacteriia bacterium]|nr:hypothetical protein [Terriglobia bacterium]